MPAPALQVALAGQLRAAPVCRRGRRLPPRRRHIPEPILLPAPCPPTARRRQHARRVILPPVPRPPTARRRQHARRVILPPVPLPPVAPHRWHCQPTLLLRGRHQPPAAPPRWQPRHTRSRWRSGADRRPQGQARGDPRSAPSIRRQTGRAWARRQPWSWSCTCDQLRRSQTYRWPRCRAPRCGGSAGQAGRAQAGRS